MIQIVCLDETPTSIPNATRKFKMSDAREFVDPGEIQWVKTFPGLVLHPNGGYCLDGCMDLHFRGGGVVTTTSNTTIGNAIGIELDGEKGENDDGE